MIGHLGFRALYFDDIPVVYDKTHCPGGYMFFVNEEYLEMRTLAGADMTPQDTESVPNSDSQVKPILLSTNINCSNRSRQGVILGLPTS